MSESKMYPGKIKLFTNRWNAEKEQFEPGEFIKDADCFISEDNTSVTIAGIMGLMVEKGEWWVTWSRDDDNDINAIKYNFEDAYILTKIDFVKKEDLK